MQLLAFIFMVIALRAVFDSHNYNRNAKTLELEPIPNMYSIHSWIGITVITLYCCQVIIGEAILGCYCVLTSSQN